MVARFGPTAQVDPATRRLSAPGADRQQHRTAHAAGRSPLKEYMRVHDHTETDLTPGVVARADDSDDDGRGAGPDRQRIGVGGGDENVAKIQLAARWAEQYVEADDSLEAALARFKRAYMYIDSVTKLVDPAEG